MVTIAIIANVYNEANALPGWLETHLPFADDIRILHAGPNGEYSNDGTLDILKKWNIPVEFCAIDEGFGVVRTKALRMSKCDYVMILDADERFYSIHKLLMCSGEPTPHSEVDAILQTYDFRDLKTKMPDWNNIARLGANLKVEEGRPYNQGEVLREILGSGQFDVLGTIRRHWHGLGFTRPTQNWNLDPDWQLRVVRNNGRIGFDPSVRMHERLYGVSNVARSNQLDGPFFDHFHFHFKQMEQEQRSHDVAVYDSINEGRKPPTREEFGDGIR